MKSQPLKWHGGKHYLAPKIIELMPKHTRYCEPFFGGGAVLLQKPCESVAEFANDLNRELTNFWRVLRDQPQYGKFQQLVECTPLSQIEFDTAAESDCPIESAVSFFVRNRQSRQALGRDFVTPTSRLRRGMNEQVSAWLSAVDGLPEFHARLRRVEIRNQPAVDFIRELDSPETCFYCDPPYLHDTRSSVGEYQHEMSYADHKELLCVLSSVKGKFLLSGYRSELYNVAESELGWRRIDFEIPNQASGKKKKEIKTECVWVNY